MLFRSRMPKVTFIRPDGQITTVEGPEGESILKIALDHGIELDHACGGNGFCTTCMCDIEQGIENLTPRNDREENMGVMDDPQRLTCQAQLKGTGDVTVKVTEY